MIHGRVLQWEQVKDSSWFEYSVKAAAPAAGGFAVVEQVTAERDWGRRSAAEIRQLSQIWRSVVLQDQGTKDRRQRSRWGPQHLAAGVLVCERVCVCVRTNALLHSCYYQIMLFSSKAFKWCDPSCTFPVAADLHIGRCSVSVILKPWGATHSWVKALAFAGLYQFLAQLFLYHIFCLLQNWATKKNFFKQMIDTTIWYVYIKKHTFYQWALPLVVSEVNWSIISPFDCTVSEETIWLSDSPAVSFSTLLLWHLNSHYYYCKIIK